MFQFLDLHMSSHIFSFQCFGVCCLDPFGHYQISVYKHHDTAFNNLQAIDLYYLYYLLLSG